MSNERYRAMLESAAAVLNEHEHFGARTWEFDPFLNLAHSRRLADLGSARTAFEAVAIADSYQQLDLADAGASELLRSGYYTDLNRQEVRVLFLASTDLTYTPPQTWVFYQDVATSLFRTLPLDEFEERFRFVRPLLPAREGNPP